MKIIIVGPAYPLRGGIAHFNALLASHLSARHTVEVVTFKRQYPAFLFPGKTQEEVGGMSHTTPAPQLLDSINPLNWLRVGSILRERNADLVLFTYWLPFFAPCYGTIARKVKRNRKTKILFLCHNILPHERRPGDIALTRYAFRRADFFLVQSDAVESDLLKLFPHAIYRKTPHPVYEIFGDPIPKDEARRRLGILARNVILFFGYVRQYKGLMVLIDAMKMIADYRLSVPPKAGRDLDPTYGRIGEIVRRTPLGGDVLLLAVGEFYDDEKKYRRKVRDLNLESCVRFVSEYVPNDRVRLYFSAADVVVLPYRSATQSGIIQIAYNFDKPVITTNVGGLSEVVINGKTGFVVPPDNPDALAGAITKFYEENRENEFASNVRREKERFSWDNLVAAIEDIMRKN